MDTSGNSFIESFKERITNPFLFTYFWVFCTYNHKSLLILFFEPKLFSNKMAFLNDWYNFICPLGITIAVLFTLPWINNFVEFWRQKADNKLKEMLNKSGFVKYISLDEYQQLEQKYRMVREAAKKYEQNEEDTRLQIKQISERLEQRAIELSEKDTEIKELYTTSNKLFKWADKTVNLLNKISFSNKNPIENIKINGVIHRMPEHFFEDKEILEKTYTELNLRPAIRDISIENFKDSLSESITEYSDIINSEGTHEINSSHGRFY